MDGAGADDVFLLPEFHPAGAASSESSQLQLFVDNLSSEQLLQLSALIAAKLQTSSPAPAPPAAPADALVAPSPQPMTSAARSSSASPIDSLPDNDSRVAAVELLTAGEFAADDIARILVLPPTSRGKHQPCLSTEDSLFIQKIQDIRVSDEQMTRVD